MAHRTWSEPAPERERGERRRDAEPSNGASGTREAAALSLQRTVGNRLAAGILQRDDTATKTIGKGAQPPTPVPSTGASVPPLSPKEREELERFTGNRIDRAFVAFVSACKDNREAVKAAAKARAETTALFIDIATGFLIPGLSKGIAKLASNLPVQASNLSYRVALAAMNTDLTKTVFSSATKVANKYLKDNATSLFGETETDQFIKSLETLFHRGADEIDKSLPTLTDTELGVVCAMYDPSVADVDAFRKEILALVTRFQREVLKSEEKPEFYASQGGHLSRGQAHAWVDLGGGKKKLALLKYERQSIPFNNKETYAFYTWISPDMEQMVLSKWGKGPWGTGLPTVKKEDVAGLIYLNPTTY